MINLKRKIIIARIRRLVRAFCLRLFVSASHGEGHCCCVRTAAAITDRVCHAGCLCLTKRKLVKVPASVECHVAAIADCERTAVAAIDLYSSAERAIWIRNRFLCAACASADNTNIVIIRVAVVRKDIFGSGGAVIQINLKIIVQRNRPFIRRPFCFRFVSALHSEGHRRCVCTTVAVTDCVGHRCCGCFTKLKRVKVITRIEKHITTVGNCEHAAVGTYDLYRFSELTKCTLDCLGLFAIGNANNT